MKTRAILLLLACSSPLLAQAPSAPQRVSLFDTFSNVYDVAETGDVVGYEITVVAQPETSYVVFECSKGIPSEPLFLPAKTSGTTIEFTVPPGPKVTCPGSYQGILTPEGLKLTINNNSQLLPRHHSYWGS